MRLDLPLDSHMHTTFSRDADATIDGYAALAREQGLAELAITDHLDFDPTFRNFAPDDYARREHAVREAAERWDGHPHIRFGVEITYQPQYEEDIRGYLVAHRYDYTIGSIHTLGVIHDEHPRSLAEWCAGKSHREASAPYWTQLHAAIGSGLFDTIGHLDVVKRWMFDTLGPFDYEPHADLYDDALQALVESGMALEVNSSGVRQKPRETYPPAAAVHRFRELGGTRVTAGTDAHRPGSFGYGLREAYGAIGSAGFDSLSFRRGEGRVRVELASELVRAAKATAAGTPSGG